MVCSDGWRSAGAGRIVFGVRKPWYARYLLLSLVLLMALLPGCGNKTTAVKSTPTPPPPVAPTASLELSAASVESGQPVTITWKTENADTVNIDPLGPVAASGSQSVTPTGSTTYRLTAKGPGGVKEASGTVTVSLTENALPVLEEKDLEDGGDHFDVYFESDQFSIGPDQQSVVRNDADFLKQHADISILVEGHCDETGSAEYNVALGVKRATTVKTALVKAGVSDGRIATISYGKERPYCGEETDECRRRNRRAHIQINPDREN